MGAPDADTKRDNGYSLSELGIHKVIDAYGDELLTITLPPNAIFGTGEAQATFDHKAQKWELRVTANTKFSQKLNPTFKRNDSRAVTTGLPTRSVKWTEILPRTHFVDEFLHGVDWKTTPLGPLDSWPTSLQAYLNVVFADHQAAVIYWGDDLVALYNEAFLRLVSGRLSRPQEMLGMPFVQMWPELWDDFRPMLNSIATEGVGLETIDINLFPSIDGQMEETFWQGSFLPIRDSNGLLGGFYNRAGEITGQKIHKRRSKVLGALAAKSDFTRDSIWNHLLHCFALADRDFPLAFIYSVKEDSTRGKCELHFECGTGLPAKGHALLPESMDLHEGSAGFVPYLRKARSKNSVLVLHQEDASLPRHLTEGFAWKGFGEPSKSLAFLPLSTGQRLFAMVVIGLNPRRPYDDDTEDFLNMLSRSLSAIVSSVIDREETQLRADRLAQQLAGSEKSIREIAEYGPVGIARFSRKGRIVWANDQYYKITGHGRDAADHYDLSWLDTVIDEDRAYGQKLWQDGIDGKKSISSSLRLKRKWRPPKSSEATDPEAEQNVWVLAAGYPIIEGDEVQAYACSVTDISRFKWAEQIQARSAKAAQEAKRLQENFIDIVSHEMRNPLSAITQLSDAISMSMDDFEASDKQEGDARVILKTNVDNANTILLCAAHQKRIVDDVLTLSKLDSMLLSITPVVVQPYRIVESVLQMFDAEFVANGIKVVSEKSSTYDRAGLDWAALDPSRLTQIFANLITNAIKFTKTEPVRNITIRVGASDSRPPSLAGVMWFPTHKAYKDLTAGIEWGDGEPVYVMFEVQDTGRGLEQNEMNNLFGRFQQATEKTHLKYGGSGLGLFISRELTETQGGEIGVLSKRGKGTTFAFYVKGRHARPPSEPAQFMQPTQSAKTSKGQVREAKEQQITDTIDPSDENHQISILLCEDNIVNSRVLKQQLTKSNCDVHVAAHGMEALDFLKRSRAWAGMEDEPNALDFDVVLMDVEMPIMDGMTCTRRIRQLQKEGKLNKHINIIAITANARQEQIDKLLATGMDDALSKPFRVREAMEKIREMIARSRRSSHNNSLPSHGKGRDGGTSQDSKTKTDTARTTSGDNNTSKTDTKNGQTKLKG